MTILTIKAFGDFSTPYYLNICVGEKERITQLKNRLNEFCRALPGCDQDISLKSYFQKVTHTNKFIEKVVSQDALTPEQATNLLEQIKELCEHNNIYACRNTFYAEEITQI